MDDLPLPADLCKTHAQDFNIDPPRVAVDSAVKPQADNHPIPHDIELEQALLGAILVANRAYERVSETLKPEHFYDPLHGEIYETIGKLIGAGRPANPLTLKGYFEHRSVTDDLTVSQYLGRLAAGVGSTIYVHDYAKDLINYAVRRTLVDVGYALVEEAVNAAPDVQPSAMIERAEQELYAVVSKSSDGAMVTTLGQSLKKVTAKAHAAYQAGGVASGISTGLIDLDRMLCGGLQKSDLIILAGRPSMGKTALAVNIAVHAAKQRLAAMDAGLTGEDLQKAGAIVGFFSLEMNDEQLAGRVLAAASEIPLQTMLAGTMTAEQADHMERVSRTLERLPLHIDQTGGIPIAVLASKARRMKRKHGLDLLIVDYLQLMQGLGGKSSDNRVQEVTQITTGLKALGKELQIPVLALSQLSRKCEDRTDKRPMLSDLRESGSIEQDADAVAFCFREEYYVERAKPSETELLDLADWHKKLDACAGKAEIIVGKQRQGPIGTVHAAWNSKLTLFGNLARDGYGGHP